MTELHVRIPDDVAERLAERAEREQTTPEKLASDAVRSYVGPAPIQECDRSASSGSVAAGGVIFPNGLRRFCALNLAHDRR